MAVASIALLACRSVFAQGPSPEPISVAYDAPNGCPDSLAFFSELSARTGRARLARHGESARTLRVQIAKDDSNQFSGRFTIEETPAAISDAREVHAATCVELVEVLGFIAALSIDPTASSRPPGASPPRDPEAIAPSLSRERRERVEVPSAPPDAAPIANAKEAVPEKPTAKPRFGVGTQIEAAAIADLVASGRLFVDLELERVGAPVLTPSLRLALSRSLDVSREPSLGAATFRWTTASIEPCPLRFRATDALALRTCAGFSAGTLAAAGGGVDNARGRTRPWLALSTQLRLGWRLARVLELEVESGVTAPLVRESFAFSPDVPVYRAPTLALFGRAGVSVQFP